MTTTPTSPTPARVCATLRALFLILTAIIFFAGLLHASAQTPLDARSGIQAWGLRPLHIDRGLDRLDLDAETRGQIDSMRNRYNLERADTREEIVALREEMLAGLRAKDRRRIDTARIAIRQLMNDLRDQTDRYGADVASLLTADQISSLLDMALVWGDPDGSAEEPADPSPTPLSPLATAPEGGMSYSRFNGAEQERK